MSKSLLPTAKYDGRQGHATGLFCPNLQTFAGCTKDTPKGSCCITDTLLVLLFSKKYTGFTQSQKRLRRKIKEGKST